MLKVIVNGAAGKMGRVSCDAVNAADDMSLVATLGHDDNLAQALDDKKPDVVIDFTVPDAVYGNTETIIAAKACPVIGATGLTPEQISSLQQRCKVQQLGGIIAPNFSLGAVLMMHYSAQIARFFPDAEIIEMHHPQKLDAPSGTAIKTAELMQTQRPQASSEIPIHSVRLPGMFAHQMVMFGKQGETLTLRHDAVDRAAMMPGLLLACREVVQLDELIYGLDNLLFDDVRK